MAPSLSPCAIDRRRSGAAASSGAHLHLTTHHPPLRPPAACHSARLPRQAERWLPHGCAGIRCCLGRAVILGPALPGRRRGHRVATRAPPLVEAGCDVSRETTRPDGAWGPPQRNSLQHNNFRPCRGSRQEFNQPKPCSPRCSCPHGRPSGAGMISRAPGAKVGAPSPGGQRGSLVARRIPVRPGSAILHRSAHPQSGRMCADPIPPAPKPTKRLRPSAPGDRPGPLVSVFNRADRHRAGHSPEPVVGEYPS